MPATSSGQYKSAESLKSFVRFYLCAALLILLLFTALRLILIGFNLELAKALTAADWRQLLVTGLRFDLKALSWAMLPVAFASLAPESRILKRLVYIWLGIFVVLACFTGIGELEFYAEFRQRLNSIMFEYVSQDASTVLNMLWNGFPLARLLLSALILAAATVFILGRFEWLQRVSKGSGSGAIWQRASVCLVLVLVGVLAARGTLRQGSPMGWGDAFKGNNVFANHMGLNSVFAFYDASDNWFGSARKNPWRNSVDPGDALSTTREWLLVPSDTLTQPAVMPVQRVATSAAAPAQYRNVVIVLMESFSAEYVGAMKRNGVTPRFDEIIEEGVLFTHFFSNGTHTHQGTFATLACFPNLPGYEYLMQQPEGAGTFSGIAALLGQRGFDSYYYYSGAFDWDNQYGFFRNQGMQNFIGRDDFVDPVYVNPTWGVSDQDLFARAATDLAKMDPERPFLAVVQTLSNHTPYAIPDPLPMPAVENHGVMNERLTAMKYADWALGEFFDQVRTAPYFKDTLFVLLGDHGFGTHQQLPINAIDLLPFHVPLLLIGEGLQQARGKTVDTVSSQVDVIPTIMGLLGGDYQHQCWGRDLFNLPAGDRGYALVKPSGSNPAVALLADDQVLVAGDPEASNLYTFQLYPQPGAQPSADLPEQQRLASGMKGLVQTAMDALINNRLAPE